MTNLVGSNQPSELIWDAAAALVGMLFFSPSTKCEDIHNPVHIKFSMCHPKGAHSLTHRWLQFASNRATRRRDFAQGCTTATP